MPANKVQVGQIWKKVDSDDTFLVTRLYTEALATVAILRPTGNETAAMLRVKVDRKAAKQTLPGFTMAQGSDES